MATNSNPKPPTPKKVLKKRTKFTILAMVNIVWYTIVDMVLTMHMTPLPSELTVAWFSAWTVELALLYGIKVKSKDDTSDTYSTYYNIMESGDISIDNANQAIDANIQNEESTPDYDDAVG